jgi:hypothetical protein
LLPLLNAGQVGLLDHPRLIAQLASLVRRTARSGRDSIDHAPGGHDDVINAAAGALVNAEATASRGLVFASVGGRVPAAAQRDCRFLVIENPDHPGYIGRPRRWGPAAAPLPEGRRVGEGTGTNSVAAPRKLVIRARR